jgi:PKD domain
VTSKNEATKLGTITETALNDDSGTGGISRTVTWGDGTPPITWAPGSTVLTHPYAAIGRYVPTVTLTDAATNTAHYTLDAIVLGDVTAPTGSVTVAPGAAWTSFTDVVLTPTTLSDDVSTADFIKVHVTWGDGTTADSKGTVPLHHRYAAAGSYDVAAAITDEAGNTTPLSASSVLVSDDKAVPVVKLLLPKVKHSVKAWTTLRGRATDSPGTGVKAVALHAIEKRGTRWYAYKTTTKTWARAKTKAKAFAKSGTLTMHPDRLHRWKGRLVGLRKGTLVYRVTATDNVGNMSARVTHKATLTKR